MRTKPALILLSVGLLLALNISPFVIAEDSGEEAQQSMTRIMMMPPEAETINDAYHDDAS